MLIACFIYLGTIRVHLGPSCRVIVKSWYLLISIKNMSDFNNHRNKN